MVGIRLIAGLGNVGTRYEGTRHNLGFRVADALAAKLDCQFRAVSKLRALVATARHGTTRIVLVKPLTYMNLSGTAVSPALKFYDVPTQDLLVLVDDVALPVGTLRFRSGGSSGGHNGLLDIERALGTQAFSRLKLGVAPLAGAQEGQKDVARAVSGEDLSDFVLGRFDRNEEELIQSRLATSLEAVLAWVDSGIAAAMNRYNGVAGKNS